MLTDNLTDMGTAKQSGRYLGFDASKALDGNRNQEKKWGENRRHDFLLTEVILYYVLCIVVL
jgi:hypothetical protein